MTRHPAAGTSLKTPPSHLKSRLATGTVFQGSAPALTLDFSGSDSLALRGSENTTNFHLTLNAVPPMVAVRL